jgi:hypothetical protein
MFNTGSITIAPEGSQLPAVLVPIQELVKLQKGFIELLEIQISKGSKSESVEDMTRRLHKMNRDSSMKVANALRDALASGDLTVLEDLEKHIRKQSFGERDADGI